MKRAWAVVSLCVIVAIFHAVPVSGQPESIPTVAAFRNPLDGVVTAVARGFLAPSGTGRVVDSFGVFAAEFDDDVTAASAFDEVIPRFLASVAQGNVDIDAIQEAPAPEIGDEAQLFSGPYRPRDNPPSPAPPPVETRVVYLLIRQGRYLYFLNGFSSERDLASILVSAAERMVTRHLGPSSDPDATPVTDGTRADGLWALLPTSAEMPHGLVVVDEGNPALFVGNVKETRTCTDAARAGTPRALPWCSSETANRTANTTLGRFLLSPVS